MKRLLLASLCALALGGGWAPPIAHAQSSEDRAVAKALSDQGKSLMHDGKYAEAIEKLKASASREARVSTLMNIGECHVQLEQLASAWGAFREAASLARQRGDKLLPEADKRAQDLAPRLSTLTLDVPAASRVPGLTLLLDGRAQEQSVWQVALPIDGGEHTLEVSAAGYETRREQVRVKNSSDKVTHSIPPLTRMPSSALVSPTVASTSAPPPVPSAPEPAPGSSLRTAGLVVGGVGLALGVVGGVIMGRSLQGAHDANSRHDREKYDAEKTPYYVGVTATALGGAALVGGLVMVLVSPRSSASTTGFWVVPSSSHHLRGVSAGGSF